MSSAAVVRDVWKSYGRQTVLRGLSFDVPMGQAFGLLGPNGAGKTTALRLLTGLARPSSGSVELLGQPVPSGLPDVLPRVGVAFEDQGFYRRLTGLENLEYLRAVGGHHTDRATLCGTLEEVGLGAEMAKPVGQYSSGMRRRLTVAAALAHDPEMLILDEPTAALDPVGVHDLRVLLQEQLRRGKTMLISSHQLREVELLADHVLLIDNGHQLASGSLDELLPPTGAVEVEHPEPDKVRKALEAHGLLVESGTSVERLIVRDADTAEVLRHLGRSRLRPTSIMTVRRSLEDVFVTAVRGSDAGNGTAR